MKSIPILAGPPPPGAESPEELSHRYHLIRVFTTLAVIGAVTMLVGLAALIDPENLHPIRYFAGCALVGIVSGLLFFGLIKTRPRSTVIVESAMLLGLFACQSNTIYGGLLDVDPWWQVCGYLVVLMIAGGASLRRPSTFAIYILVSLFTWVIVIEGTDLSRNFVFDSYTLMGLGAVTAGAILVLFRIERQRVTRLNIELVSRASRDPLTGILNRNGLFKSPLIGQIEDGSGPADAWCAYLDVDYFKSINDRRGHDHGDEVLRAVAGSLADATPQTNLTARWGGDEFVIVGHGPEPDEEILESRINTELQLIEPGAEVTVGVAASPQGQNPTFAHLLRRADHRMYERRGRIRNQRKPDPV